MNLKFFLGFWQVFLRVSVKGVENSAEGQQSRPSRSLVRDMKFNNLNL